MKLSVALTGLLAFGASVAFANNGGPEKKADKLLVDLQKQAIKALKQAEVNGKEAGKPGQCTLANASVRKDWNKMSAKERKAYSKAVQCLANLPAKTPQSLVPGVRTRYDDFVAQHINQTFTIHMTGNFFSWHRYYIWGYEQALRNECGYKGAQPYWNWFQYTNDLKNSPVFDGSPTSMGGDGEFKQHNGSWGGIDAIFFPSGEGGGCIKSGPLKHFQANLGPLAPIVDGIVAAPSTFAYNPRCVVRDLSNMAASNSFTYDALHNVTLGPASADIASFSKEIDGRFQDKFLGLHSAGHIGINGDASDFFSSPVDPVFFMHHAMLDQVWWIWQALHQNQAKTIYGTITLGNNPPSRNTTLDDLVQTNYLNMKDKKIGQLMDTLGGEPFCYVYV